MGKKEEPMIAYYEDVRHFAWLVNGWICQGEKEIDEALIKPKNIRLTGKTGSGRTARMRSRYRDVFKEIGKVKISYDWNRTSVICRLENHTGD